MLENLTLVALLIALMWVGALGLYLYSARQNKTLSDEIDAVSALLDEDDSTHAPS